MNNNDNAKVTLTEEQLQELTEDQLMELFCEQMMIDKGLDELSGKAREDVRRELVDALTLEINRSILAALPDDKFDELDKKMTDGTLTAEEITAAVEGAGLDLDKITEETMMKFRELYLAEDNNGGAENVEAEE